MAHTPTDMDGFLPLLTTQDTKAKLTIGAKLHTYLCKVLPSPGEGEPSIECSDIGLFIDSLLPWVTSSNHKLSLLGLDILITLCEKMGAGDFKPFVSAVLPMIIDRLGDSKEPIREKSQAFLLKLMETDCVGVQYLFDRLTSSGFSHKNAHVREQCLKCLDATLVTHGTRALTISKLVPHIVKLLSDPHASVRDAAFSSLVVIYKFVGDRLKLDLTKKYPVPANKLAPLLAKFEDIKLSGELEPAASLSESLMFEDEVDRARSNSLKRSTLQSLNRKAPPAAKGPPEDFNSNSLGRLTRTNSLRKPMSAASSDAGGVSEDYFERAYDDVPQVVIFSSRDVEEHFSRLRTTLADTAQDWSRRVEALKKVRALVMAAPQWEELAATVRGLEQPLETCVKDLRSQVVREACITIAYLSRHLGARFDHTAEALLPSLIALIPNSAKVISTSSHVALRLILSHTHYPRLIPVIARSLNSKSKDIRRACCEFVELILKTWQTATLERQVGNLQDVIKKGIADADPEARVVSRKAYWSYVDHWPDQGEALLNALDPVYKRALMSNSSSTNSLSRSDGISTRAEGYSSRAEGYSSRADSISSRGGDSYSSRGGDGVSSSSAGLSRRHYGAASTNGGPAPAVAAKPVIQPRSSSAIDLQAVQRAKVRAQYAALARQKVAVGSLPRSRKNSVTELTPDKERAGRTRSRVSMSTPTSRSGSPSSRLSYSSYSPQGGGIPRPRRGSSGIPRSTDTSRESSPSRYKLLGSRAGSMGGLGGGGGGGGRPPRPTTIMAAKILQASREAESALADALDNPELSRSHPRRGFRGLDDHSDESETSSLCSEVSFDSACVPRRASDSYSSWNGSQSRIYRDICESTPKDIGEIISNCESTHWNDRKDGLVNLQCYLQAGNLLSPLDLKRITDIFTKMFMDSHTKVFSLFLDCFNELIVSHHQELHAWLYLLISRLLNKQGADLLGSVHSKILRSLDVVRDSFPPHLQLQAAFRFLSDPTQTPNTKVKLATLGYVMKLATITDPALAFPLPAQGGKDFATLALSKLIGWTRGENLKQTPGGGSAAAELRRAAQETIVALFNLNTPQITFRFSLLPQEYQEAAATLITTRVRKSSAAGATETTGKSPSHPGGGGINNNNGFSSLPSSPRLGSPHAHESRVTAGYHTGTPGGYQSGAPPGGYHSLENAENLNPEEIYRSLRRTTAEIVKLSGGGGGAGDSERGDSVSYDSGISQMSAPGPEDNSSTTLRERTENNIKDGFGLQRLLDGLKESEKKPVADRKQLLSKLHECVQVNTSGISLHFKGLLYQLLSLSEDPEPQVREYAITILNAMLKKSPLLPLFASYIELVVLKVINRSKDTAKDVYKACETCALSIAVHLPPEKVTRILFPLIVAEEHPINLVAIKMLTKVIEVHGHGSVEQFLPNIMPALLQAYENEDSCVRKCAVFCMVALHREMGEARLAPYILKLSGAKLKLLQLYIKRSQSHSASSVPTSPKSNM